MADRRKLAEGDEGRLEGAFGFFLEFIREKVRRVRPANKNAPERAGVALGQVFAQLVDEPSVQRVDALIRFMKKEGIYENTADEKIQVSVPVDPRFGVPPGFTRMYASGNNSDCLIHSFLTAVSREFRTLDKPSRDEFANVFRRGIFPVLPLIDCIINRRRRGGEYLQGDFEEKLLRHRGFLHEGHVYALSVQFGVNVAMFSHSRNFDVELYGKENISVLFQECLPAYDGRPFRPTVMIKEDGTHFEPITTPDGAYVIDMDAALALEAMNEANRLRKICPACSFANTARAKVCSMCSEPMAGVPPRAKGEAGAEGHVKVCPSCTLVNEANAQMCAACETDLTKVKATVLGEPAAVVLSAAPVELGKVCPLCTLVNEAEAKRCVACETDLTKVKASVLGAPAAAPAKAKISCPICTYDNNIDAYECEACGAPLRIRKTKGGGKTRNKKNKSKHSRRRK